MFGLATKDQLDWRESPEVREAQAALTEANAHLTTAKAQYDVMWRQWNIQGVPLAYNSPARPAEERYLAAQQAKAEAEQALRAAEATAKATVFHAWRDGQHERFEVVVGHLDGLIESFRELERWTDRGLAAQIPLLDLKVGAGQLHADGVTEMRNKFQVLMDRELLRQT